MEHLTYNEEKAVAPPTTARLSREADRETGRSPITFDEPGDPLNPQNWTLKAKWTLTLIFSAYDFMTLMSSSMIAPALKSISRDLDIRDSVEEQVVFSAFILASAAGPLLFAPLSEMYGRKNIVQGANAFFLLWTIVCGFSKTKGVMVAGRVLSGLGASVVFGVSQGAIADCWRPSERGRSLAVLSFAPLLGPALGPIIGGALNQYTNWRWIFWSTAIGDFILQILATFFLKESYAPVILARKAASLRKTTGRQDIHAEHEVVLQNPGKHLGPNLTRPFKILFTHTPALILTLMNACTFGVLYILLATFATTWTTVYGHSDTVAGLHYLAVALGLTVGTQVCGFLMDRFYRLASKKGEPSPEIRMRLILPGIMFWYAGLLLYGWGIEKKAHWIVPDIGVALFSLGSQLCTTSFTAYFADTFGKYTASALAGGMSIRSVFAFAFPLFAPTLVDRLGYGVGNSIIGSICFSLGIVIPLLVLNFGAKWRAGRNYD